jgi:predicted DNA-binding antitoxin AbrB/MazE fold protein
MAKKFPAIYENGVLRPPTPLALSEQQRVEVMLAEAPAESAIPRLDHEYMEAIDAAQETEPSLAEVRQALSGISGNLSDDIRAKRDMRG